MKLSELFPHEVVTVSPDDCVATAAKKMSDHNVGAVVVIQDERVVGIVTDRDVALEVALSEAAPGTPVREIMTENVLTIWDDEGVFNATQYLSGHPFRRLPIVDHHDRLVGMLTADDLFGLLARELFNVARSLEPALGAKV